MSMKKIMMLLLSAALLLVACGGSKKDERSIDDFANAFIEQGVEVDMEEKPFFQMIGAMDGVIFYMDKDKVAIYQYDDEKTLEKAQKENELIKDWPVNGRFLLESNNEKALEIFSGVTQ